MVGCGKESMAALLSSDPDLTEEALMAAVFRECKKEKLQYRLVALEAAGRILRELRMPYFGRLYEITFPLVKKEDEDDVDMEDAEAAEAAEASTSFRTRMRLAPLVGDELEKSRW